MLGVTYVFFDRARTETDRARMAEATAQADRSRAFEAEATAEAGLQRAMEAEATAEEERGRAEQQAARATARELAGSVTSNLAIDPERSILLALHATDVTSTTEQIVLPEVLNVLNQAVQELRVRRTMAGQDSILRGIDLSPDGSRLVTCGDNETVHVWDTATGASVLVFRGHTAPVYSVAIDPGLNAGGVGERGPDGTGVGHRVGRCPIHTISMTRLFGA